MSGNVLSPSLLKKGISNKDMGKDIMVNEEAILKDLKKSNLSKK